MHTPGRTVLSLLLLASLLLAVSGAAGALTPFDGDRRALCCDTDAPEETNRAGDAFCASGACFCGACASIDLSRTAMMIYLPENAGALGRSSSRFLLPEHIRSIDNPPRVA